MPEAPFQFLSSVTFPDPPASRTAVADSPLKDAAPQAAASAQDAPTDATADPATASSKTDTAPPAETPANKLLIAAKALRAIEQNLSNVIRLLEEGGVQGTVSAESGIPMPTSEGAGHFRDVESALLRAVDGRVVEGVFDGRQMVGADGKTYAVPANYASKSKLVEGDLLKLTITPKGSFIYKQIGPIERSRVIAALGFDHGIGEYFATSDNRRWSVLKASVTYFKGDPGDEVVLLVPKSAPSKWAAVENIIKKDPLAGTVLNGIGQI